MLHSNRTHPIFWEPAGSGLTFDPGYESLIETFLSDVAADSHKTTNIFSLSGQYRDHSGPAAYDSTYGGAVRRHRPAAAERLLGAGRRAPGWTVCLTDGQLETELERVVAADHLPTTNRDIYFMITPTGFGSCTDASSSSCALGGERDRLLRLSLETAERRSSTRSSRTTRCRATASRQPAPELAAPPTRRSQRSATSRTRPSPTRTATPGSTRGRRGGRPVPDELRPEPRRLGQTALERGDRRRSLLPPGAVEQRRLGAASRGPSRTRSRSRLGAARPGGRARSRSPGADRIRTGRIVSFAWFFGDGTGRARAARVRTRSRRPGATG